MPFFLPTFLSTTFSLFYAIFPISWKSFFRFSTAIFLPPFFRCPFSAHPFFDVFSPFPHFNAIFLPHFFRRNFFFKAMQSWCVRQSFFLILCHFWRYFFLHIFIYPIIYFTVLGTIFTQENSPRTKWLIRVKKKDLGFSRVLSLVSSQWTRGEKQDVGHATQLVKQVLVYSGHSGSESLWSGSRISKNSSVIWIQIELWCGSESRHYCFSSQNTL